MGNGETVDGITFYRTKSDIYGNPRYIVNFLQVIPESWEGSGLYARAVKLSHRWGGAKYRGRDFGGGIVVQSYNLKDTADHINRVKTEAEARA